MTSIADAISHISDLSARQTLGLAKRYLENASGLFDASLVAASPAEASIKTIRSEIDRAHEKLAEARALSTHDDVSEMISKRIEAMSYFLSGRLALGLDKAKEAIGHFESCLYVEKENAQSHFALGLAFMRAGKRDEALESVQTALALAPENMDYLEYWDKHKGTTKLGAMMGTKSVETTAKVALQATNLAVKGLSAASAMAFRFAFKRK